jgi:capsular polysaccharide biosynthesis protein/MinD-like ATPase involved in chromosome partitioning or flagellar assembly
MDPRIDRHLAPASMQGGEEAVDVRRYIDALRRSLRFIAVLMIAATLATVVISMVLPDQFTAVARLVFQQTDGTPGTTNTDGVARELATTDRLLTTPQVLQRAARDVPGSTRDELASKIESTVSDDANIIDIQATDTRPDRAAAIANAVANGFIAERTEIDRARIERARTGLIAEIEALQGSPSAGVQISAIRQRISELTVAFASAGSQFQVAEKAEPASAPASPRPLRNGVLAFVAALFLGVLLALGRDLLVPRVGGARDLSRLTRLTVLAGVPYVRSLLGRRSRYASAAEDEGYETLRAWVELELAADQTRVILLTSAVHSEGKTTATARLGQALAEAGYGVLLVSADLRRPTLHQIFDVDLGIGVADVIEQAAPRTAKQRTALIDRATVQISPARPEPRGRGELSLMTSGTISDDAIRALNTETVRAFYTGLRGLSFDYVLVDGPPLLGIADATVLAQEADDLLVIARLDRITVENAVDLREVLGRLNTPTLGLIVIGAPSESSPYYLPRRSQPSEARSTPTRT